MITVNDILDYLKQKYPLDTACDFDNVGLLVGDGDTVVSGAVVCLDCDINTVSFAKQIGANLVITHHPVIFDALKSVVKGTVVYELLNSGVSAISMHTNLDIAKGGVTERLCEAIGLKNVTPYTAHDGFVIRSAECDVADADTFAAHIKSKLGGAVRYTSGKKNVSRVLVCSGSGGDFLTDVINGGFDALICGDIKHNVFVSAVNAGVSVFDAGHYHTENVIVNPLCLELSDKFSEVKFAKFDNENIKTV